jgi:hypothetical protein
MVRRAEFEDDNYVACRREAVRKSVTTKGKYHKKKTATAAAAAVTSFVC